MPRGNGVVKDMYMHIQCNANTRNITLYRKDF